MNRVWKIRTSRGLFAVKVLNRDERGPLFGQALPASFQVEEAAVRAGIPTPRPIPTRAGDGYLAEIPRPDGPPALVRAHEWAAGWPPGAGRDERRLAGRVGALLAGIHALPIDSVDGETIIPPPREDVWRRLQERGCQAGAAWAVRLAELIPVFVELERLVLDARAAERSRGPIHGDADQKNFLVSPVRLLIFDWDMAGVGSPSQEIATAALDWGGVYRGAVDARVARSLLEGYADAGGAVPVPAPTAFGGFFSGILRWLEFNLRRSLGEVDEDERSRKVAEQEVASALRNMPRFAAFVDDWVYALS
jgi:Ser/Thr protein kinase RdoA (MazF antagonist)